MLNSIINVDLHIHSKISEYKEYKIKTKDNIEISIVENSNSKNIDVLLDKLNEKNINLFAFSDHNRFDSDLYKIAKGKIETRKWNNILGIVPAVEFDVQIEKEKPSCHIITVFDANNEQQLLKIEEELNKDKISKEEHYSLDRYEKLLRKIGLNVILIACQRKSLDNSSGGKNSISNSVENIYNFLKIGFISALEFQKPSVEGMLLNNLHDFPFEIGLVCGSDCHQWDVYPMHDEKEINENKKFYFTIKALPNFMGLLMALTSPKTRFKRKDKIINYVPKFILNNETINLSPGFNAIIGENGSGKSSLINMISSIKLENYQKKLMNMNGFSIEPLKLSKKAIAQNEIIQKNKNKFIFDETYFSKVDHSLFENAIKSFSDKLFEFITYQINKHKAILDVQNSVLQLKENLYFAKTYYITVDGSNFETIDNPYKDRVASLNSILVSIKNEISFPEYSFKDKNALKEIYNKLNDIRTKIIDVYKKIYFNNEMINIIIDKVKIYNREIEQKSNTEDIDINLYKKEFSDFNNKISSYYKMYVLNDKTIPNLNLFKIGGFSEKKSNGYSFIAKAKYYDNSEILNLFLEKVFNKEFSKLNKIESIDNIQTFVKAISGANESNYKEKYNDSVNKFIEEMKEIRYEVIDVSSKSKMGNTLGERALVYYKHLSYDENEFDVLFIDQPEDNISNTRINKDLINYLNSLRDKKQIIFVTHNPLLVVNLDVDNVIIMNNLNGKIQCKCGCLEDEEILENVALLLDGGKETIEKRLKLYGRKNNKNNN